MQEQLRNQVEEIWLTPILGQYLLRPTDRAYNSNGTLNYGGASGRLSNGFFNVAALQKLNEKQAETARGFANFSAEYKILKNLKL